MLHVGTRLNLLGICSYHLRASLLLLDCPLRMIFLRTHMAFLNFFLFWPPRCIQSCQARNPIRATVAILTPSVATPRTHTLEEQKIGWTRVTSVPSSPPHPMGDDDTMLEVERRHDLVHCPHFIKGGIPLNRNIAQCFPDPPAEGSSYVPHHHIILFFLFFSCPTAYGSSQPRDQIQAPVLTCATAAAMPDP